jgi:hypothetical protein
MKSYLFDPGLRAVRRFAPLADIGMFDYTNVPINLV